MPLTFKTSFIRVDEPRPRSVKEGKLYFKVRFATPQVRMAVITALKRLPHVTKVQSTHGGREITVFTDCKDERRWRRIEILNGIEDRFLASLQDLERICQLRRETPIKDDQETQRPKLTLVSTGYTNSPHRRK